MGMLQDFRAQHGGLDGVSDDELGEYLYQSKGLEAQKVSRDEWKAYLGANGAELKNREKSFSEKAQDTAVSLGRGTMDLAAGVMAFPGFVSDLTEQGIRAVVPDAILPKQQERKGIIGGLQVVGQEVKRLADENAKQYHTGKYLAAEAARPEFKADAGALITDDMTEFNQAVDQNWGEVKKAADYYVENPYMMWNDLTRSVPSLITGMAASKAASLGLTGMSATKAATGAGIATGAMLEGSDAGLGAMQIVEKMKPEQLQALSEPYNKLIAGGATHEQAVDVIARNAGADAFKVAAIISAIASKATGSGKFEADVATGQANSGVAKTILGGAAKEGAQEFVESGGGQVASNYGVYDNANSEQKIGQGFFGAATQGAMIGSSMGAGMGAFQVATTPKTETNTVEGKKENADVWGNPANDKRPDIAGNEGIDLAGGKSPVIDNHLNRTQDELKAFEAAQEAEVDNALNETLKAAQQQQMMPQDPELQAMAARGVPVVEITPESNNDQANTVNANNDLANVGDTNVVESQATTGLGLPTNPVMTEDDKQEDETANELPVTSMVGTAGIQELPLENLTLSNDVPQFKDGANADGVVEPLGGKFDRTGVAPIQVWERKDGRMEIISGRHRADLARRSGEQTIPAQIHREADGFDATKASTLDAELNIRDGQGKVKDYVQYFTATGIDKQEANDRGLLSRTLGKRSYTIATQGSEGLITAHRNDSISDSAAEAIAINFPKDEQRQLVAIQQIAKGKTTETAINITKALGVLGGGDTNLDMFGFDDSAIKEAERMAKQATAIQRSIDEDIRSVNGAAKNPTAAAKFGVNVKDPEGVKNRIAELKQQRAMWDNWQTNPDLVAQLRGDFNAVTSQPVETAPIEAVKAPQNDLLTTYDESTIKAQEQAVKAAEKQQAQAEKKAAIDAGVDGFTLDMGNVPDDDGGATVDMFAAAPSSEQVAPSSAPVKQAEQSKPSFDELIKSALTYKGAIRSASGMYGKDVPYELISKGSISDTDNYLIDTYGIDRETARSVTNHIQDKNLKAIDDDVTAFEKFDFWRTALRATAKDDAVLTDMKNNATPQLSKATGKPFASEKSAKLSKTYKSMTNPKIVPIEGGYAVVEDQDKPFFAQGNSWVVKNKATGEVIFETYDKAKVDAINKSKYEAVPIGEYLASLNNAKPDNANQQIASLPVEEKSVEKTVLRPRESWRDNLVAARELVNQIRADGLDTKAMRDNWNSAEGLASVVDEIISKPGSRFTLGEESDANIDQKAEAERLQSQRGIPVNFEGGKLVAQKPEDKSVKMQPTEMDALKAEMGEALSELVSKLGGKMNMTPEKEAEILPIMGKVFTIAAKMGYVKFKDAAKFVLDQLSGISRDTADMLELKHLQAGYINAGGDIMDAATAKTLNEVLENAKRATTDTQPDSATNSESATQDNPSDEGRGRERPSTTEARGKTSEVQRGNNDGMGNSSPAVDGKPSVDEVYSEKTRLEDVATRSPDNTRSTTDSTGGLYAERAGAKRPSASAQQTATSVTKGEAKPKPQIGNFKAGDYDQIAQVMPFLTDGQKQDVVFAENRFYKPDGFGVLFTNGTGTGKTFTGLGVVKRISDQGKTNILIAVPKQTIADAWVKAGKRFFNLSISTLKDTKDAGDGIVVTTFANMGVNSALINRRWDMFVIDESHYLSSSEGGNTTTSLSMLRALALKENANSTRKRAELMMGDEYAEMIALRKQIDDFNSSDATPDRIADQKRKEVRWSELMEKLESLRKEQALFVKNTTDEEKPRVLMLSATPFAYEKSVDIGDGFLFSYGKESESGGYNSGSAQDKFMMQHFGYRMRYNKLTEPDAKVDRGLMQRNFNSWLKKQGVLSGRALDSDFDYDRKFVLTESAIGKRVDQALEWLRENASRDEQEFSQLQDIIIGENFNYHNRMYFLEAIKASQSVDIIKQHLDMGRKVVVMHDFKKGGVKNPFRLGEARKVVPQAYAEFQREFSDLIEAFDEIPSAIQVLTENFPDALVYNGDVPAKQRVVMQERFNSDEDGSPRVIIAQGDAMREGVSIHDTTGKYPRVLVHLGMPTKPTAAIQQEGRIYRTGQASNAIFRYMTIGSNWERTAFASKIASRASTAENLALGEAARGLKESFIQAYEDADNYPAGFEGEGTGGKEADAAMMSSLTPWDQAKALYYGVQKQGSGRSAKGREHSEYFATPEPVGFKMVQLADMMAGDKVLEPSAGHGAIARFFPDNVEKRAIEYTNALSSKLALHFDGDLMTGDFMDHNTINKYDAIVMNPPYGTGGKQAAEHVGKAMKHLRDGGRIVALIPTGPAADKQFDKLFSSDEAKGIYTVANILMPSITFERAGTSVSTRIVVLEKQTDAKIAENLEQQNRDYRNVKTVDELFDRMENLEISPRAKSAEQIQAEKQAEEAEKLSKETGFKSWDTKHTKTNADLYLTKPTEQLDRDDYIKVSNIAKQYGGYWNKFAKGFLFNEPESRDAFIEAVQSQIGNPNNGVKQSVGVANKTGSSADQVIVALNENQDAKRLIANGKLNVVQSVDDFPQDIKLQVTSADADGKVQGLFDPATGKSYLIADNLSAKDALGVATHEVGVHAWMANVPADKKAEFGNRALQLIKNGKVAKPAIRDFYQGIERTMTKANVKNDGEEAAAYIVEKAINDLGANRFALSDSRLLDAVGKLSPSLASFISDYVAVLRSAMHKLGWLKTANLTGADLVAIAKRNMKSMANTNPTPPTGGDKPKFSKKVINDTLDEIEQAVSAEREKVVNKLASGADVAPMLLALPTLKQLADLAKNVLPQIQRYTDITDKMAGYRNKLMTESGDIATDVRKWVSKNRPAANRLFDLMHEATISGIDPSEPYKAMDLSLLRQKQAHLDIMQGLSDDHAAEIDELERQIQYELSGERRAEYDALAKKWALIPAGGRNVYQLMRDHYKLRALQTQKELLARIARSPMDEEMKAKSMTALRLQFESTMRSGVYFPLARFGEYWLVGKNEKGEKEFRMYDSEKELQAAENKMLELGYEDVASGVKLDATAMEAGANSAFVADTLSKLDEAFGEDAKQLKDDVYQFYLQSLPDMSMRKSFIHRKKTKGYSQDALRAFAQKTFHMAHQLSKLRHSDQLSAVMNEMRKETNKGGVAKGRFYNEMVKRHEWVLNPNDASWSANLTALGFVWYLGASPAAAAVNTTQLIVTTLPVLSAEHDLTSASAALGKAMKDAISVKKMSADEQAMMTLFQEEGVIDTTMAHDLAGMADTETGKYSEKRAQVMGYVSWMFHQAEVFNRRSTALAAYRLAKAKNHADPVGYARQKIWETQFDYSNSNRARWMQNNAAKVILLFKQYSQNMSYFIIKNAKESLTGKDLIGKKLSKQDRSVATRKIAGLTLATLALGGLAATPFYFVLAGLAGAAGDDEEPQPLMAQLVEWFGEDWARFIMRGGVNQATGIDISSRMATDLAGLWYRADEQSKDEAQWMQHFLVQQLGPVIGIAVSGAEGVKKINDGNVERGIENMVPKFVKDAMQATRFATEGALTLGGDKEFAGTVLVDEFNAWEVFMKANGFTPEVLSHRYDQNSRFIGKEKAIQERRAGILSEYWIALRAEDNDAIDKLLKNDIPAFNEKYPQWAISGDTIQRSVKTKIDRMNKMRDGVLVSPKMRAYENTQ